ncbi:MAG: hypothetical protein ACPGJV_06390 [Bacteriovoracaceae bacterium]
MKSETVIQEIEEFNKQTHGSSNYHEETFYIKQPRGDFFVPFGYLKKKIEGVNELRDVLELGFVCESLDLREEDSFREWYEKQFARKLKRSHARKAMIVDFPYNSEILDAIETVNGAYDVFRKNNIILNGKNLPVQIGEWYAKCIFGLHQNKSASQRGFDFYLKDSRVEVKVHWSDQSSPKGVKVRKSLVDLSEYVIVVYVSENFMIREVCFLDSGFVMRKFSGKGHTIFLKDSDIAEYFFSRSSKHLDKVVNSSALLKFATPNFALKLSGSF